MKEEVAMECGIHGHTIGMVVILTFAILGLFMWWNFKRTGQDMETVYWPDGKKVHDPKRAQELRSMHCKAMFRMQSWKTWTARYDMNTPRMGNGRVYFQLDETGECIWEHIGTQSCWGPTKSAPLSA